MKRASTILAAVCGLATMAALPAEAASVRIKIVNHASTGGLSLTPLFVAFHNGNFDSFDLGGTASAGVEEIAELGSVGGIMGEALAADPNARVGVVGAPGGFAGAPVIEPGEQGTFVFRVNGSTQRFFSYLSMVIPSNDTFIGNPDAIELFDAAGNFLGNRTFNINGNFIWDAGTEANDLLNGAAFLAGINAAAGDVTQDSIGLSMGLAALAALQPNGQTLNPALADFFTNRSGFQLATLSVSAVPVPGALPLMGAALAAGAVWRRRARRKTA